MTARLKNEEEVLTNEDQKAALEVIQAPANESVIEDLLLK